MLLLDYPIQFDYPIQYPLIFDKYPAIGDGARIVESARTAEETEQLARYGQVPLLPDPFNPVIPDRVFVQVSSWQLKGQDNEVGFFFWLDQETGRVEWVWLDPEPTTQSSNEVIVGTARAVMAARKEIGKRPNGIGHSHVDIGTFWSATDRIEQIKFIERTMVTTKTGSAIFLVVDGLDWLATRFTWKGGKLERQEGYAVLEDGTPLKTYTRPQPEPMVLDEEGDVYDTLARDYIIRKMLIGYWSNDDLDYLPLFNMFRVRIYRWYDLFLAVEREFPDGYFQIVDSPAYWSAIKDYLDIELGAGVGYLEHIQESVEVMI